MFLHVFETERTDFYPVTHMPIDIELNKLYSISINEDTENEIKFELSYTEKSVAVSDINLNNGLYLHINYKGVEAYKRGHKVYLNLDNLPLIFKIIHFETIIKK